MRQRARASLFIWTGLFAVLPLLVSCGLESPPRAPSLFLPQPVTDLTVSRSGNEVHLHWTMPKRARDRVKLDGDQQATICRSVAGGQCESAGKAKYAPGTAADFTDHLPPQIVSGPLQLMAYTVELSNHAGRTAGPSNQAYTVSGAAPAPASGFAAQVRGDGVLFQWQPSQDTSTLIRIDRTLVPKPGAPVKPTSDSTRKGSEAPAQQRLEVAYAPQLDPARAFDKDAAFNQIYRYTAQRIATVELNSHKIEIASSPSETITVDTRDIFPPSVPAGLVAVASPDEHVIDLSWTANTENDLAGYIIYRREAASSASPVRISPDKPVPAPAFRDSTAKPGVRYAYSVSAVDQDHNESARSQEAQETLPQ